MKISRNKQFEKDFTKHFKTMQDKHFQSFINAIIMPLIVKTIFCEFLFLFIKLHYVTFFYILEFDEIYNNYTTKKL